MWLVKGQNKFRCSQHAMVNLSALHRYNWVLCLFVCLFPSRFLYCLQLCDDIRANRVHVDRETAIRLTALMLQGMCVYWAWIGVASRVHVDRGTAIRLRALMLACTVLVRQSAYHLSPHMIALQSPCSFLLFCLCHMSLEYFTAQFTYLSIFNRKTWRLRCRDLWTWILQPVPSVPATSRQLQGELIFFPCTCHREILNPINFPSLLPLPTPSFLPHPFSVL